MQVVVIGAGVLGSSLAWRLAQRGMDVTLVERSMPASGTTGSSFAWFNANQKRPEDYFRLNLAGMEAHRGLRDELGDAPWLHEGGNLVWVTTDDWMTSGGESGDLEARVAELQRWDYPAHWLPRSEATELEPNLRIEEAVEQCAYFPSEGWIDGLLLARSMVERAAGLGTTVRYGAEVTGMEREDGRITGVRLANGEVIEAELVVNCAGPAGDRVAAMAGRTVPLAPTLGFVVRVSGLPAGAISRVIHAPKLHLRPDGDGLVALHHGDADAGITAGDPPHEWAATLIERLRGYLPEGAGEARLSRWTIGIRPIPGDGRTSAGLVPAVPAVPVYGEILTHSAITMGALLPRLVSEEIVDGMTSPLLANFRPERFSG